MCTQAHPVVPNELARDKCPHRCLACGKEPVCLFWGAGREICFEAGEIHECPGLLGVKGAGPSSAGVTWEPRKALDQGLTPGPVATCWDLGAPWNGQQGDAREGGPRVPGPPCTSVRPPACDSAWSPGFAKLVVSVLRCPPGAAQPSLISAFLRLPGSGKSA